MRRFSLHHLTAALLLAMPFVVSAADTLLPPGSGWEGRSGPQLAAEWWQWASAEPDETNPVQDLSGAQCAVGQRGTLWFLAGGFGSSLIQRTCTVPAGKALFFPIINMAYYPQRGNTAYACARARSQAALNNDAAVDLFAEIDGVPVPEPKRFRVATEQCFNIFGRIAQADRPYEGYPAATDGYWLLLNPLPKGRHVLKFGGRYNRSSTAYGRSLQDIEYRLNVQ